MTQIKGWISRIAGPVVHAKGMAGIKIRDLVRVGNLGLIGETIEIKGAQISIQVYEETDGLQVGEPVVSEGQPFLVELGPGLLGQIYDGIQRPLEAIRAQTGAFIERGSSGSALDRQKKWAFVPTAKPGDSIGAGNVIGWVQETPSIKHHILVPHEATASGPCKLKRIGEGQFTIDQPVAELDNGQSLRLAHRWPIRTPRPYGEKIGLEVPLLTGQRILDTLFPIAKGGSAIIPGPFGSGKTVTQQTLAKWAQADVVVYVGCGERGNEMTEILTEFPHLEDPRSGQPLLNRTVVIANTSNMPVAARETSIYTGITIAEYFRDMGYDVALMADSTSRWAEALREISGRLEEMPGEEGYPSYLASRVAEFYERAGRIVCLGAPQRVGSVTVIGAVSPPGGDFSEPVTQNSLRIAGTFWGLDAKLAYSRHFPAINWLTSYTLYLDSLRPWFEKEVGAQFLELRARVLEILQQEEALRRIVQLVGIESLSDPDKLTLEIARLIRESFLRQSAFHPVDSYCPLPKQRGMMHAILAFYDHCGQLLEKTSMTQLLKLSGWEKLSRMGYVENDQFESQFKQLLDSILSESPLQEVRS